MTITTTWTHLGAALLVGMITLSVAGFLGAKFRTAVVNTIVWIGALVLSYAIGSAVLALLGVM